MPDDARVTPLFTSISLDEAPEIWAEQICQHKIRTEDSVLDYREDIADKGYDIVKENAELLRIYQAKLG